MKSDRIALVLAATGGIGGEAAFALPRHGWKIRALSRAGGNPAHSSRLGLGKGDALDRNSIMAAARAAKRRGMVTPVAQLNGGNAARWVRVNGSLIAL
jgi:uncharacterized protein YbjT (DUF2867 family)